MQSTGTDTTTHEPAIVRHDVSAHDQAVLAEMKRQSAAFKGAVMGPEARPGYDQLFAGVPGVEGAAYHDETVAGVPGIWVRTPGARPDAAMLYLHGGGYVVGSAAAYRHFAGQFSAPVGLDVFVADYALAPEQPFPAAVEQTRAVYAALRERGYRHIVLVGDSAGGGLALSLLAACTNADPAAAPACAVLLSPWTDLTLSGETHASRADDEFYLGRDTMEAFARQYLAGQDASDPRASPLFGSLARLPPVEIHVGSAEVLLSDSEHLALKARAAGSPVTAHVWNGLPHVFPMAFPMLPAAQDALRSIHAFIARQLAS